MQLRRLLTLLLLLVIVQQSNAQLLGLVAEEHAVSSHGVTYRFYAEFNGEGYKITSVFATEAYLNNPPILIETDDPSGFYQSTPGFDLAQAVNPFFFAFYPQMEFDSWVTIGADAGETGEVQTTGLNPQFIAFNNGETFSTDGSEFGGLWFTTTSNPFYSESDGRVLLAQLTVTVGHVATFQCNVQWRDSEDNSNESIGLTATAGAVGGGCLSELACNYNAGASSDDGSCVFPIDNLHDCNGDCLEDLDGDGVCNANEVLGCDNANACNFESNATEDDGSCVLPNSGYDCTGDCLMDSDGDGICNDFEVVGCQNVVACNYDVNATDSGSCVYASSGYDCSGVCLEDADGDGVCDEFEVIGCQDAAACNFNASATEAGGECEFPSGCSFCSGETNGSGTVVNGDADNDGVCNQDEISGCQTPTACNYNTQATDSGSCTYALGCDLCSGETDGSGVVLDLDSDNDGICNADEILGCTNSEACNYSSAATDENGTCLVATGCDSCSGESDGSGTVLDGDSDNDGVCDTNEVIGCQNNEACNFNAAATDSGSCSFPAAGYNCAGDCLQDEDGDGTCDEFEVTGCLYSTACNYLSSATDDDGSCVFAQSGQDCNGNCLFDTDSDGICDQLEVVGCLDATACNYDSLATESGYCDYPESGLDCEGNCLLDSDNDGVCDGDELLGCMDPEALNYDPLSTESDGSCSFQIVGCTYETACNFHNVASIDDGSCFWTCFGCMDATAENFSSEATIDDGTCYYSCDNPVGNSSGCFADLDFDGVRGTPDLLLLLSVFGIACED